MQAVQNIAVINGKPSIYGDAMLAVCQQSPNWEWMREEYLEDVNGYECTVKRRGADEHSVTFTEADAKQAGLWAGSDPWRKYAKRMLQMRARGFALRDTFADCLKGIISAEEAGDYHVKQSSVPRGTIFDTAAAKTPQKQIESQELISAEELELLETKMFEAGSDVVGVCNAMKIASLDFVPKHKFGKMLERLDDKITLKHVPRGTQTSSEDNTVAEFFADEKTNESA